MLTAFRCPYKIGNTLSLQLQEQPSQSANVTILKTFELFSLSCALLVHIHWPHLNLNGQYVLKLYDRRFATQLREDVKASPWNPHLEDQYCKYLDAGTAAMPFANCSEAAPDHDFICHARSDFNEIQLEAWLKYFSHYFYVTESDVYTRLQKLQGEDIPHLAARVLLKSSSNTTGFYKYLDCPRIILEFLEGFALTDIEQHAPAADWQHICEEAIRIINKISDHGIRNEDVNTRSFIIGRDLVSGTTQYKVCMIDFGACILREPNEDEQVWRYLKADQDEEGAVGKVMESNLRGGFKYTRSKEYERLDYDFMREECGDARPQGCRQKQLDWSRLVEQGDFKQP